MSAVMFFKALFASHRRAELSVPPVKAIPEVTHIEMAS